MPAKPIFASDSRSDTSSPLILPSEEGVKLTGGFAAALGKTAAGGAPGDAASLAPARRLARDADLERRAPVVKPVLPRSGHR